MTMQVVYRPSSIYISPCLHQEQCSPRGLNVEIFEMVLKYMNVRPQYILLSNTNYTWVSEAVASGDFDASPNGIFGDHADLSRVDLSLSIQALEDMVFIPRTSFDFHEQLAKGMELFEQRSFIVVIMLYILLKLFCHRMPIWKVLAPLAPIGEIFLFRQFQCQLKLYTARSKLLEPALANLQEVRNSVKAGDTLMSFTNSTYRWLSRTGGQHMQDIIATPSGHLFLPTSIDQLKAVTRSGCKIAAGEHVPFVVAVLDEMREHKLQCSDRHYVDFFRYDFGHLFFLFSKKSKYSRRFNAALVDLAAGSSLSALGRQLRRAYVLEGRCTKSTMTKGGATTLRHINAVFYFLGFGLLVATALFLIEHAHYCQTKTFETIIIRL